MCGSLDRWWAALVCLARLYALCLYTYLASWAAYSAYASNSSTATRAADGTAEYSVTGMTAEIPIRMDATHADEYRLFLLYYTRDGGKAWQLATTAKPTEKSFRFTAPEAGEYSFALQVTCTNGEIYPADTEGLRVAYRIHFGEHVAAVHKSSDPAADNDLATLRRRVESLEKRVQQAEIRKAQRDDEAKKLREQIEKLEKRLAELENEKPANRD